jgi:hypothetical protein
MVPDMGSVHDLIVTHGKQGALEFGHPRDVIEAAAAYLGDEEGSIGYLFSGWCQAALPHKRLPNDKGWQIKTESLGLIVEPGMRFGSGNEPVPIGVPFGSKARMILFFLQSEALRTGNPEVLLGHSMREWLKRMNLPWGGKNNALVREQAERIARCRMTFQVQRGSKVGLVNQNIVEMAMFNDDDDNCGAFIENARLSDSFFAQLKKHPVPLADSAIKALSNNSMGLDVYAWLAYRLHVLERPTPVSWKALKGQFGLGVERIRDFRRLFQSNLQLAMSVYPAATVNVSDAGLTLYPSFPPVSPRKILAW